MRCGRLKQKQWNGRSSLGIVHRPRCPICWAAARPWLWRAGKEVEGPPGLEPRSACGAGRCFCSGYRAAGARKCKNCDADCCPGGSRAEGARCSISRQAVERECNRDCRFTPRHILDRIHAVIGPFDLDPCADRQARVVARQAHFREEGQGPFRKYDRHLRCRFGHGLPNAQQLRLRGGRAGSADSSGSGGMTTVL